MSNLDKVENEVLKARIKAERAILKELEEQYAEALKEIDDHIAQLLGSQNANLPHMIHRVEYQRMIKQQVQAALDKLHSREYESVNAYLNDCYTDAFVGTMYTLHQQDMPVIVPIDQNLAVKAITLDTRLNETMYEEMGKDISQLKKTIRQEITRGISSGMMYSDIARNISNAAGIPMRRARNIARTEAGRVQEQASHDAAMKAVSRGANLVKQWSAIRDAKTRDAHRMLHKQTRELNEYFEIDGKKAMHPHDFGDPALDCNCRCTTLHVARASLDEDTLKRMQEDAHAHGLLVKDSKALGHAQAKNIGEFKKSYLKAAETVDNTGKTLKKQGKSGIIQVPENPFYKGLSKEEIATRYRKKDGSNLLETSMLNMPIDMLREAIQGYDSAISMYGDIQPQRIKAGQLSGRIFALYSPVFKTITLNTAMSYATGEAYATLIHEMTHHAETSMLFNGNAILKEALKKLGLRSNSKQADVLKMRTVGSLKKDEWNDPSEIVAYAIERQLTGRTNDLTEAIYTILKEKGVIK